MKDCTVARGSSSSRRGSRIGGRYVCTYLMLEVKEAASARRPGRGGTTSRQGQTDRDGAQKTQKNMTNKIIIRENDYNM